MQGGSAEMEVSLNGPCAAKAAFRVVPLRICEGRSDRGEVAVAEPDADQLGFAGRRGKPLIANYEVSIVRIWGEAIVKKSLATKTMGPASHQARVGASALAQSWAHGQFGDDEQHRPKTQGHPSGLSQIEMWWVASALRATPPQSAPVILYFPIDRAKATRWRPVTLRADVRASKTADAVLLVRGSRPRGRCA